MQKKEIFKENNFYEIRLKMFKKQMINNGFNPIIVN